MGWLVCKFRNLIDRMFFFVGEVSGYHKLPQYSSGVPDVAIVFK